jgi:hypothetical protein
MRLACREGFEKQYMTAVESGRESPVVPALRSEDRPVLSKPKRKPKTPRLGNDLRA